MSSIFSKIAAGEIPSFKIAEDDRFFAFMDINPVQPGHILVVPKREVDNFFDIPDSDIGDLMQFAKKIAVNMKEKLNCRKVAVAVIGLEVPHAHMHLIPINKEGDMDFGKKLTLPESQMSKLWTLLKLD